MTVRVRRSKFEDYPASLLGNLRTIPRARTQGFEDFLRELQDNLRTSIFEPSQSLKIFNDSLTIFIGVPRWDIARSPVTQETLYVKLFSESYITLSASVCTMPRVALNGWAALSSNGRVLLDLRPINISKDH